MISALERIGQLDRALALRRAGRNKLAIIEARFRGRRIRRAIVTDEATHRWIEVDRTSALCRVAVTASTGSARASNFRLALDVLRSSGVDFFFVPLSGVDAFRIGVRAEQRTRLFDAVLRCDLSPETYLSCDEISPRDLRPFGSGVRARHKSALLSSNLWTIWDSITDPTGSVVLGERHACQIEFWDREADELVSAHRNAVVPRLPEVSIDEATVEVDGERLPTSRNFLDVSESNTWFPIDIVYTWVDDSDPAWIGRRAAALDCPDLINADAASDSRFTNRDELRYSLRSVAQYADFVRHVYLVTDGQTPSWLDPDAPGLTVVDHRDIFGADDLLPTFNSHAIEARLHHIEGLSDHYLYLNDDVFFGRRVSPAVFYRPSGLAHFFLSRAQIPAGDSHPDELSVDSAAKNGRALMHREFGTVPTRKFKHTPHAQRRDVLLEIEKRFPAEVSAVGRSRFRSHTDISMASSLHHYVADALGLGVPGSVRYDYVNLSSGNLPGRLERMADGTYDCFCLNDADIAPRQRERIDIEVASFLRCMFPWPSPWERRSPVA